MNTAKLQRHAILMLCLCSALLGNISRADDIDIFTTAAGGSAATPNVIFLLDNSPNWSRASQHWPDNSGNQGQAELAAIKSVVESFNSSSQPVKIGFAMLNAYGGDTNNSATPGTGGAYMRFGARDMTVSDNRDALSEILTYVYNNITDPTEKVGGMANKDESAGFYEIYKYLSALTPYSGIYSQNPKADVSGNPLTPTGAGQGLSSGFAIDGSGTYTTPVDSSGCDRTYIIYIANNANNTGSSGNSVYQPSVASVSPALTPVFGTNQMVGWTDEWTHYLYSHGVPVPGSSATSSVVTFVLDAYNAQNNSSYSYLLQAAAKQGGGKYYQVGNQSEIVSALLSILAEIQGVNSTFASAALPVNTTNRAQDKNQVFIPMFRPDSGDHPLWMGNLKQYQLVNVAGLTQLGDAAGDPAISSLTGYPTDCATSFWTTDSGTYWLNVNELPLPEGKCTTTSFDPYSDAPDGPIVEKGGTAEVIRKGNNPPSTDTTPTWAVNRTIYTVSGGNLATFSTTTSGLSATVVDFAKGEDVNDENGNSDFTETRPSLHGDSIHSRPLPIDYGGSIGVTTYYGSNDGMFRAVDANTGRERWAFVAPEHFSKLARLQANSPLISYPGIPAGISPTPEPKDYFFDGSTGIYQNADNTKVWIYPTMRRGGRMIYAFNVTNPAMPTLMWHAGCPHMGDNTGCAYGDGSSSTSITKMGQTWSTPVVAFIKGYSTTVPVLIVGGGYDSCEDSDTSSPSCSSPMGAMVYVLNAETGALIKSFATTRSVASDISLVDIDNDGYIDSAYAADTGGNIYRIDFATYSSGGMMGGGGSMGSCSPSTLSNWVINRVAYTNGAGRKFLFAPGLLPIANNHVYLAIASGDREHPLISQYPYTTPVANRFYVYLDDLNSTTATNLDDTSKLYDFTSATTCATNGVLPTSSMKGWFMNLNANGSGEQGVTSALIIAGQVTFSTNQPVPPAPGSCVNSLGIARGYWVNLVNGSGAVGVTGSCGGARSNNFIGGGLPPSPVMGTVPVDGKLTTVVLGAVQKDGSASGVISPQQAKPTITPKRKAIYWKFSGSQ